MKLINLPLSAYRRIRWIIFSRLNNLKNYSKYIYDCINNKSDFCPPKLGIKRKNLGHGDGMWTICSSKIRVKQPIVYSFGVGDDISFDLDMINQYSATVYAFDPTPISNSWVKKQNLPSQFKFFNIGISSIDGVANFSLPSHHSVSFVQEYSGNVKQSVQCPVSTWKTITNKFNHTSIDIVKIDIEGGEYDIIDDILESPVRVEQLLVEFHHRFYPEGIQKTRNIVKKITDSGYMLFNVSIKGLEYSFVKK
jgi:FkbM family methyltransferase